MKGGLVILIEKKVEQEDQFLIFFLSVYEFFVREKYLSNYE